MKSEDYVRTHAPNVRVITRKGHFSGGKVRTDIYLGRSLIGCDTRPRSAWAEAMRWLQAKKRQS